MINTFRDCAPRTGFANRLMMHPFDRFRNLIKEIDELKAQLKQQNRRIKPPICTYTAYTAIMAIATPLF